MDGSCSRLPYTSPLRDGVTNQNYQLDGFKRMKPSSDSHRYDIGTAYILYSFHHGLVW